MSASFYTQKIQTLESDLKMQQDAFAEFQKVCTTQDQKIESLTKELIQGVMSDMVTKIVNDNTVTDLESQIGTLKFTGRVLEAKVNHLVDQRNTVIELKDINESKVSVLETEKADLQKANTRLKIGVFTVAFVAGGIIAAMKTGAVDSTVASTVASIKALLKR